MSKQKRIAVLFGGRSAEHEVSVLSATNVVGALDPERYDAVPVLVTREGRWLLSSFTDGVLAQPDMGTELCLVPGGGGRLIAIPPEGAPSEIAPVDAVFPVLHGLHAEDGAVQGLAQVARVPLVGCGILGSAVALDKAIAKRLLKEAGLPVARALTLHQGETADFADVERQLGSPVFIKPARQGSSVGVSRASNAEEFSAALATGFAHDDKLVVEEFIRGREIEFSVLEDEQGGLFVSRPGEIAPAESHGFYSYEAKYLDEGGAALSVPAVLPQRVELQGQDLALKAFRALGCDAMARVDFFLTEDMRYVVNEINTIPGFTNISMYAKAMAASGVSYAELIDRLVRHGLKRGG